MRAAGAMEIATVLSGDRAALGEILPAGDRLAGTVALMTGAGSAPGIIGVGALSAMLFARQGARIAIVDIDRDRAAHTAASVEALGGAVIALACDVCDEAGVGAAIDTIMVKWGRLDIAINNAALLKGHAPDNAEGWRHIIDVNLVAPQIVGRAAAGAMKVGGKGGSIINIGSIAGLRGMGAGAYASSKGGLLALTRDQAFLFGDDGIRVNYISIGHVLGPMAPRDEASRRKRAAAGTVKREGTAFDVAWAALFLASEESRWISGASLPVDGGAMAMAGISAFPALAEAAI